MKTYMSKKMYRIFMLLLAMFIFVIQFQIVNANDDKIEVSARLDEFITSIDLKVMDGNDEIDYENGEKIPQTNNLSAIVHLQFEETVLKQFNDALDEEDEESGWISVPTGFIPDFFTRYHETGKLLSGNTEVGDYEIANDGSFRIKYIDSYRGINKTIKDGNLYFDFQIDTSKIIDLNERNEKDVYIGDHKITLPFDSPKRLIINKEISKFEQIKDERIATYKVSLYPQGDVENITLMDVIGSDLMFPIIESEEPLLNQFILYDETDSEMGFPIGSKVVKHPTDNGFILTIPKLENIDQGCYTIIYQAKIDKRNLK